MYFLYSFSVVAPMHLSSPLASCGLRRFPASIAPSEAPAPTSVCISSMKRTTFPSEALTSSMTPLSLSSNSPLNLAPASRLPMSRAKICLSCRDAGTSPATTLCARASITAVFPTPGSPIRTGLFLLLRDRMWTHLLISSSLPMTGSSFPSLASWVRSLPYLSRDSYVSSACLDSTFLCAGPLTFLTCSIIFSLLLQSCTPQFLSPWYPNLFVSLASASTRCSTDTYESSMSNRICSATAMHLSKFFPST
mmetsp:Transcript_12141/g.33673  ORF Transcript_12141/g.33673 Transcript_12141/m.33673 type:complete len:250 (+) Transcript_12141:2375-3124(+)